MVGVHVRVTVPHRRPGVAKIIDLGEETVAHRCVGERAIVRRLAPSHPAHVLPVPFAPPGGEGGHAEDRRNAPPFLHVPNGAPQVDHGRQFTAVPGAGLAVPHMAIHVILPLDVCAWRCVREVCE